MQGLHGSFVVSSCCEVKGRAADYEEDFNAQVGVLTLMTATHELCQHDDCPKKATHKIETRNQYHYFCQTHLALYRVTHPTAKGVVIEVATGVVQDL